MWHIARNQTKAGPFTTEQLEALAKQGKLLPTDLVWRKGMANWVLGTSIPETAEYFKNATLPSIPGNSQAKSKESSVPSMPGPKPAEDLEVLEEENEEEENIPVVRAKSKKNKSYVVIKEVETRRSGFSFLKLIGYMSGAIFLLFASLCVIFAVKGVSEAEKRIGEVKDRTLQGDNDKILQATVGVPLEIEPNHYIIFDKQGNHEVHAYLDNLIGNQFALRIHDNSFIEFSITNSTNDGKVWDWQGFSDVGPLTDEFGNRFRHLIAIKQVDSGSGLLKFLDNRPMSVHPSKLSKQILMFEKLPDTSKKFNIDLKYGKTLIKLSGEKNQGKS